MPTANPTESITMTNTKALEVAREVIKVANIPVVESWLADKIQAAIDEATQAERAMCDQLAEALLDAQAGLTYIRSHHGKLYGVGFDRCETNSLTTLTAYTAHKEGR